MASGLLVPAVLTVICSIIDPLNCVNIKHCLRIQILTSLCHSALGQNQIYTGLLTIFLNLMVVFPEIDLGN